MFSQGLKLQPKLEQKRDRGCLSAVLRPALVHMPWYGNASCSPVTGNPLAENILLTYVPRCPIV